MTKNIAVSLLRLMPKERYNMNNKYVIAFTCKSYNDETKETYAGPGFGNNHTMPYEDIERAYKFSSFDVAKKFYEDYKDQLSTVSVYNPCIKRIDLTFLGYLDDWTSK